MSCPSTCEYLQEARKHEPGAAIGPAMGNRDIHVSEEFVESHAMLVAELSRVLASVSAQSGAVDSDARETLANLIQTYRTLQNGVIYEPLPANPIAARLQSAVQQAIDEFRRKETQRLGMSRTRDSDVLRLLVFFERLALDRNNGRPRGRAFLDVLHEFTLEESPADVAASSLIVP